MTLEVQVEALAQRLQATEYELAKALEYIDELKERERVRLEAGSATVCCSCEIEHPTDEMFDGLDDDDKLCRECWEAIKKENRKGMYMGSYEKERGHKDTWQAREEYKNQMMTDVSVLHGNRRQDYE